MSHEGPPNIYSLTDVPTEVIVGKYSPLRQTLPDRFDLMRSATKNNISVPRMLNVLSIQLGVYNRDVIDPNSRRQALHHIAESVNYFLGKAEIPYYVFHTTQAIFKYGMSLNIDPRAFKNNQVSYLPNEDELKSFNIPEDKLQEAIKSPARLVGATCVTYYDIDENIILMYPHKSGPYKEKWSVGGGHSDNLHEIPAFPEASEEIGIDINSMHHATPVGTTNQIVIREEDDGYSLEHYFSLIWECQIPHNFKPKDPENKKEWRKMSDEEVSYLSEKGLLTPNAQCCLELLKFI